MQECEYEVSGLSVADIDKLYTIVDSLNDSDCDAQSLLNEYIEGIYQLCGSISSPGYTVLHDLCIILVQGIDSILSECRALTVDEIVFLKGIPKILSEYIEIPKSKIPDVHLLGHLKSTSWPRPLTVEEAKHFSELILNHESISDIRDNEIDDSKEVTLDDCMELASELDVAEIDNNDKAVSEPFHDDVVDISSFVESRDDNDIEPGNDGYLIEEMDRGLDDESIINLSDFSDMHPDSESEECNDDDIDSPKIHQNDKVNGSCNNIQINESQQELIDLVCQELEDIVSDQELSVVETANDSQEDNQKLVDIAEQIENIANAVELIDMQGLGQIGRMLSSNIHTLALNEAPVSIVQAKQIRVWPTYILSYLKHISDIEVTLKLIDYVSSDIWPERMGQKEIDDIKDLLLHPEFKEEEIQSRQDIANQSDISLDLPDDVNQELLDGLLQDLPVQAEEFSTAIRGLTEHLDLSQLEVAQRIAHTLKGAGNVVGVKGIANLTHHLEDILEVQSKAKKVPSRNLLNVLSDAADCLEAMSEALLGIDSPPDNSLAVFQSILDWANQLDREGATEYKQGENETDLISPIAGNGQALVTQSDTNKNTITLENMLRVPVKLADELLRIAGENLISTSQVQEYIRKIQNRYKQLKSHNQALQQLSFDLEHIVDVQGIANTNDRQQIDENEFDPLELDQYHELHSMSRRLIEVAADSIELTQVLEKDLAQLNGLVITQDQLQKENEELVLRTRMISTKTIIARLKRGVKQACRLTGKQVDLNVIDNDTYMDSDVLNSMVEPLMHILRNAVDHGIESVDERKELEKKVRGSIDLIFSRQGGQIVLDIHDDGRGLDLDKIRDKAMRLALVVNENDVTESNVQQFILHPGFSTRDEVSQVSGRGIGLDVVNTKIRELKGSVEISSQAGRGCRFVITLPVSSFSTHSLLIRVRDVVYAISNRGVEEVLYPGLGELQKVGNDLMFKVDERLYPTRMVESLLSLPEDRRECERHSRPVVLIKNDTGATTAILVQEVIDSRDVVVKSMGPYIPKIAGIVGATVLGDGSIAPVIDLPELFNAHSSSIIPVTNYHHDEDLGSGTELPYVLVVDDSLSARKSLAQFVQDLGLDVRTARDGMEAVSLIDARKPDLVLVDMEMPRMNGLELTSHIRASETTQNLPVIMITSRSTDKHRKTAIDKGVNHYMVKPFAEEELASHINLALKIA